MIAPATQSPPVMLLEAKLKQLEMITRRVEEPGTPLTEAIALVEEGAVLSEEIERELSRCDERVQALIGKLRPTES
jgi:exodeoxyribonuclease VII small subunit